MGLTKTDTSIVTLSRLLFFLLIVILIIFSSSRIYGQSLICDSLAYPPGEACDTTYPVHNLTVAISAYFADGSVENGFGLIIGIDNDLVHIATANHIVRKKKPDSKLQWRSPDSIIVTFYSEEYRHRKAKGFLFSELNREYDLAFIHLHAPYPIKSDYQNILASPKMFTRGKSVINVGKWEGLEPRWEIPESPGILTKPDTTGFLIAKGIDVRGGFSGTPLFVDSGVVGIINYSHGGDRFQAIPITKLEKTAKNFSSIMWKLEDYRWFSNAPRYYLGLGIGTGNLSINHDESNANGFIYSETLKELGNSGNVRFAFGLKNNFLIGVDFDMIMFQSTDAADTTDITFINGTISLTYYPTKFIYARLGPSLAMTWTEVNGEEIDNQDGYGFSAGAGLQISLGKRFYLVPSGSFSYQKYNSFDASFLIWTLGIIYTF